MISRMQSVNMTEVVQAAVAGTIKDYERLQKSQMLKGEDSKGGKIGKYKNKKYAAGKHAINPLPGLGYMDFKLTGDFYKEFFTRLSASSLFISSTNKKTKGLLAINKDVFTLNKSNASEYSINYVKPVANKIIKRQLSGNVV